MTKFLDGVSDERRRHDCDAIVELMSKITKSEPKMWGASIIGFGTRRYKYDSGREIDWMIVGFSPRKQDLTLYLPTGFPDREELLSKLGKHKSGKGCLYIKALDDVHLPTLRKLITESVRSVSKQK